MRNSFDHLVSTRLHDQRHCQAERLRRLEIDGQLEFHRLLDRQVGRLFPFENALGVAAGEAIGIGNTRPVTDQPTDVGKLVRGFVLCEPARSAGRAGGAPCARRR